MTNKWQLIETAPLDGTAILAYIPDITTVKDHECDYLIYVVFFDERHSTWVEYDGEQYASYSPTHWMPMPDPPEAE